MGKNIVILCDGTGKEYGEKNTNVVHSYILLSGLSANQLVLYDPGIGTFTPAWLERHFGDSAGRGLSKAFGYGLRENLQDTYTFLMRNFKEHDEVYLIGFSRGAFTVRCLAGVLTYCGLLWPHEENLVPYVIRHYFESWKEDGKRQERQAVVENFKRTFTRDCVPKVVSVWDTVNSYGFLTGAKFPNTRLHPSIPYGYQALALDECRASFKPSVWEPPVPDQEIEQVWFAGAHSDVGGGYVERGLSDIALKWLLEKTEARGLRLVDDWKENIKPDPHGRMHDETKKLQWSLINRLFGIFGEDGIRKPPEDSVRHPSVAQRQKKDPGYKPGGNCR